MHINVLDDRSRTKREVSEKTAILQRLARIEGQVRGLRQMAEGGRNAVDQIQQINAVIAALREVALLSIGKELSTQIADLAGVEAEREGVERLIDLLRSTFRFA